MQLIEGQFDASPLQEVVDILVDVFFTVVVIAEKVDVETALIIT